MTSFLLSSRPTGTAERSVKACNGIHTYKPKPYDPKHRPSPQNVTYASRLPPLPRRALTQRGLAALGRNQKLRF